MCTYDVLVYGVVIATSSLLPPIPCFKHPRHTWHVEVDYHYIYEKVCPAILLLMDQLANILSPRVSPIFGFVIFSPIFPFKHNRSACEGMIDLLRLNLLYYFILGDIIHVYNSCGHCYKD